MLGDVKLSKFPVSIMENDTVTFVVRVTGAGAPVTRGNCTLTLSDGKKTPAAVNVKAAPSGPDFVSRIMIPAGKAMGQWTAFALWRDGSDSAANSTYITVTKPSFRLHAPKYSDESRTLSVFGNIIDPAGDYTNYKITGILTKDVAASPAGSVEGIITTENYSMRWSLAPYPYVFPGSEIIISVEIKNNRGYGQDIGLNATLKTPMSVRIDQTTIKKTAFVTAVAGDVAYLQPRESKNITVRLDLPDLHTLGNGGIFPLRLSSRVFVNLDVVQNGSHAAATAGLLVLPKELAKCRFIGWMNATAGQFGDFSVSASPSVDSFDVFLVASKVSGESAYTRFPISVTRPRVSGISAVRDGVEVALQAAVESKNRVVSALFQYSTDGTKWANITLDVDPAGGWNGLWNISDMTSGDYYLRAIVRDELNLEDNLTVVYTIPGPPPDYSKEYAAVLFALCVIVVLALAYAPVRYRDWKENRLETRRISGLNEMLRKKAYRGAMIAAFGTFIALNRKYEKLEYRPAWNLREFKAALREGGTMTPRVASFLSDYSEARFSTHDVGEESARNAVKTIGRYRKNLIRRREDRKNEVGKFGRI
jgi:hypothetical protein